MFAILIAWIYITFLCWVWGALFLQLIRKISPEDRPVPHFSIICIAGLSIITIVAGLLSLIIPLGQWWVQFIFIAPCIVIFFRKISFDFFGAFKKEFYSLQPISLVLLLSCLFLVLVMSSWTIVHPDTLGYHAQTMQWIEKFKPVPGLVHLHVRFGYQGLWFVDCALFDFSFTGKQGITYLNATVLFWFFIFIINRIDINFFKAGKRIYGLFWLGLLSLTMWSYSQVRLTATSASPDFIATIFILLIIYMIVEKEAKHLHANEWLLAGTLSVVATTIKLSAAPILLISLAAALLFLIGKKIKVFILFIIITLLAATAFVARNIITSGYVIFPSTTIDIVNVDWKYSYEFTANEKNYITAYAKKQGVKTKQEIDSVNAMTFREWLPGWWQNRSNADKAIIILFIFSLIVAIVFFKKIINSGFLSLLSLITMLGGIIFWLMNAPDPRFGFGFILGFIALIVIAIIRNKEISIGKNVMRGVISFSTTAFLAYTGYRLIYFFEPIQLITPLAIENKEYRSFECDGVKINSPVNSEFGITPVPCTDLGCEKFSPRSPAISDGFRSKSSP